MQIRHAILFLAIASAVASTPPADGDEGEDNSNPYTVTDLRMVEDSTLNYVDVVGEITANRDPFGFAPTADVRFYDDGWDTLITDTSRAVGDAIEASGESQRFEIGHFEIYVQPATSGFDRVCAEIRVEDSNMSDWTRVGCEAGSPP